MLKFKNLTFDEQNYWGLIFLAKCIDNCGDLTENEFIQKSYNDYQFKELLGCSFLLVTSNIYDSITDMANRFGFIVNMKNLDNDKFEELKTDTFNKFEQIFTDRKQPRTLLGQFKKAYNLS